MLGRTADIKPDNFLFLRNDDESPLKATDFGLSIRHWPEEAKLTSRSGTPAYMAPELVLQVRAMAACMPAGACARGRLAGLAFRWPPLAAMFAPAS